MFLEKILRYKRTEVETRKNNISEEVLETRLKDVGPVRPFAKSITGESIRLIAEVKKASPSKGLLCPNFNPESLAVSYEQAGAAAISVLTDERFFQGSLTNLDLVKKATRNTPVLRKDFIVDPYQLIEARVAGADAVLLIAAALTKTELRDLLGMAADLTLTSLVEVHHRTELETVLAAGAKVIGINNRDLQSFNVDIKTTFELVEIIPDDVIVVSESGIRNPHQIRMMEDAGVDAVLVGESLVTASDPGIKIRELLGAVS